MPKQVWSTLKEARKAAARSGRSLVVFVPEDKTRHQAALDFFKSLEGMKARSEAEVWLPEAGDPEASRLLDDLGLRSLPALAALNGSGKQTLRYRLGEECVPLSSAFGKLLEAKPVPTSWLQDWVGRDHAVEPFLAFAKARKLDLAAGAQEPHRTWLMGFVGGKDKRLQNWAATRLVEANAPLRPKEFKPFPILLELLEDRFQKEVLQGNRDRGESPVDSLSPLGEMSYSKRLNPPLADLGNPGQIADKAPCWSVLRGMFRTDPEAIFSVPFYVLMAPSLLNGDRDWVLRLLAQEAQKKHREVAHRSTLFWIATDWLVAYGRPSDWEAFKAAMLPLAWDMPLAGLKKELEKIPAYWNSEPGIQSMFCEGESQESFWENPEPCLAAWGVTREALVEFGIDKNRFKGTPPPPRYPDLAKRMHFSTNLRLRMIVGTDGRIKWARPEPGYALSFFAPVGLSYAEHWQFEPARVAGVPRPSNFQLTMPFALRKQGPFH